ncbi:hypothetical protein EV361DRAFT_65914 [Lentinula raphanica]|nr:hypothetical protein EV361DRAFT_65914 [Lentinula raphanica]
MFSLPQLSLIRLWLQLLHQQSFLLLCQPGLRSLYVRHARLVPMPGRTRLHLREQILIRSSRTKSRKRTNPDSGPQPAAKKAKQHSKGWSDLVPQTDGRVMMVNDKGVSEGYVTQNADGNPILVDENGKFLKTLPNRFSTML